MLTRRLSNVLNRPTASLRTLNAPIRISRVSFASSAPFKMKVLPVPVRDDNYAYLLIDDATNTAAAVDPYDVSKVKAAAEKAGVQIVAGITTHHHFDHSGGNNVRLKVATLSFRVYTNAYPSIQDFVCIYGQIVK